MIVSAFIVGSPFVDQALVISFNRQLVIHQRDIAQVDRPVFKRRVSDVPGVYRVEEIRQPVRKAVERQA
ncbi:TPA: hypothetical protein LON50_002480 [Kluyvera ascorbata]|nr:hypothetical protein [Kluyvera ascorbata]